MTEDFVMDAKKANKLTNLKFDSSKEEQKPSYDIEELRREMENPLYSLSKTIINNLTSKITTLEEYNGVAASLQAVREYLKLKEEKGEKIEKSAAITKAAIRDGWTPNSGKKQLETSSTTVLEKVVEQGKSRDELEKIKKDPISIKLKKRIQKEFSKEDYDRWLSELEVFSLSEQEVVFSAPSKFIRDWVIREFIETKTENNLKEIIKKVLPAVKKVGVASLSQSD